MKQRIGRFLVFALPFAAAGCGPVTCPLGISPGLVVEVREAGTGRPAAAGTRGLVFRGTAVADTLRSFRAPDDATAVELVAARIGPGIYRVTLERLGYERWSRDGVEVRAHGGECGGIRTTRVRAELLPARS